MFSLAKIFMILYNHIRTPTITREYAHMHVPPGVIDLVLEHSVLGREGGGGGGEGEGVWYNAT